MDTMSIDAVLDLLPPLTAHDRCDHRGCQAQAYVSVLLRSNHAVPLVWCAHHWREIKPEIMKQHPFAVRDDIHTLVAEATR